MTTAATHKANVETYLLDMAWTKGGRQNLTIFERRPSYVEVRELVKRALAGEELPEFSE